MAATFNTPTPKAERISWRPTLAKLALLAAIAAVLLPIAAAQTVTPLTLPQAVSMALEKNPLRKAALADTRISTVAVREARSPLMPKITFSESALRGNDPVFVFGSRLRSRTLPSPTSRSTGSTGQLRSATSPAASPANGVRRTNKRLRCRLRRQQQDQSKGQIPSPEGSNLALSTPAAARMCGWWKSAEEHADLPG